MKVVDLKQLIKDLDLNERGLFTKLKKKQDLVDYLVQTAANNTTPAPPPTTKRKQPLKMPRAVPVEKSDNNNEEQAEPAQKASSSSSSPHPLQVIYDRVHEQYPPLKYLAEGNSTLLGEQDIRQRYHPMLQSSSSSKRTTNNNVDVEEEEYQKPALSGDMDLIFVGTASCTPSITRGVSCTALRLHSLASSASVTNKKQQQQQQTMNVNGKEQRFDVAGSSQSNLGTWLFDCGESTQLQIQKTSSVRPSKITKIFLTHAHGDHSFGLPGLLCLMGQDNSESKGPKAPIDIYGPEGLRLWLRTALRYSVSRICPKYRVHELKDVAMAPEWGYSRKWERYFFNKNVYYEREKAGPNTNNDSEYYWGAANNRRMECPPSSDWLSHLDRNGNLRPSELYGEVEGGRDIYPIYDHPLSSDGAPVYEVENEGDDGVKVYAAPMSHGVPCVGYIVQEADRPGRLRDELVKPICQRNIQALREAGFRHPMKALAVIKDLPEGGSFTFPDGTVVTQEDAVEPTRPGRKVVVCGDTNSARSMEKLAKNADVVVHEATNTYLPALDHRDATHSSVTKDTIFHGHSTPVMAGEFSRKVGAKRLILNHFSARYTGDQSLDSMSIMNRIEDQAIKASGLDKTKVAAAWDFMIYPIPKADRVVEEEEDE
jgi:ribonuclease Z